MICFTYEILILLIKREFLVAFDEVAMYKEITMINAQNVELTGYFFEKSSRSCVLFIHDYCSAFNNLPEALGNYLGEKNISFLCGLMQATYLDCTLKQYTKNHTIYTTKQGGAIYENYDDCLVDIEMWFDFLAEKFDNIYLVGHGLGANKAIYFASQKRSTKIKGLILIAPQDWSGLEEHPQHDGMMLEATHNITDNQPNQLLAGFFLGQSPISSKTFFDFVTNPNLHNFCYLQDESFDTLRELNLSTLIILGDLDPALDKCTNSQQITALFDRITAQIPQASYAILHGATHLFKNREVDVAQFIDNFIAQNQPTDK